MKNGKLEGIWISYYPNEKISSIGKFKNNLLDSTWLFFNEKGELIQEINYLNGKKNGYFIKYYEGKEKAIKEKYLYINDKIEGKSYIFYENGNIKRIENYKNGKIDGYCIDFNKENIPEKIENYKNGKLIEEKNVNRYNEKGQKNGLWIEIDNNYNIKNEVLYDDGIEKNYSL